jgi:TetR/AcrR family transcriptional repressor of bet genes
MKSKSISAIRRAELSRATFEAVVRYGLRNTTFEKVGEIAGVSKGVVLHHFKDKGLLLAAMFRRSNGLLRDCVIELYRYAETPHERLWAIIVANFHETIFNGDVCQAWVSLLAEAPHNVECQKVQMYTTRRIHSNLVHELKHFLEKDEAEQTARQIGLLIDGIWTRNGSRVEEIDSKTAISEMEFTIMKLLPSDPKSTKLHKDARAKNEMVANIALGSKAFQEKSMMA